MFSMKDFADLLGVEMEEEFQLCDDDGVYAPVYRVTKYGFEYLRENKWVKYQFDVNNLIGKFVRKLPWKPRNGDKYWYVDTDGTPDIDTFSDEDIFALEHYACKNCFRTEDEAKANINEVTNRLKAIYEQGEKEQKAKVDVKEAAKMLQVCCTTRSGCEGCEFEGDEKAGGCVLSNSIPVSWKI